LLLTEDWVFRVENSDANNYVFFGPNLMSEIQVYIENLEGSDPGMTADGFARYLLNQYSNSVSDFETLIMPTPVKCGIYDASIIAFSHTLDYNIEKVRIELAGFTENHVFRLVLAEISEDFIKDIEYYETILSSFLSGPIGRGTLANILFNPDSSAQENYNVQIGKSPEWRQLVYFSGAVGSGLSEDFTVNGSKMRILYEVKDGQVSISVYDSETKKVVSPLKTVSLNGYYEVDIQPGKYFLSITCMQGNWNIFIEEK